MSQEYTLHFPSVTLNVGYNHICDPSNSPLRWIRFGRIWLPSEGNSWTHETGDHEETLTLLRGSGQVQVVGGEIYVLELRDSPFTNAPVMLHIPAHHTYTIVADAAGLDGALAAAPAAPGGEPLLFPAQMANETSHGQSVWKRKIQLGTVGAYPIQRIMVGETLNIPGGWTSFPPHKHDIRDAPHEMPYEEIYFFLLQPQTGFAIQYIYDSPQRAERLDSAIVVRDGDAVVIPHGYHPVVGMPGHQMYYLWILCGEVGERTYGQASTDPNYAWLLNEEPAPDL